MDGAKAIGNGDPFRKQDLDRKSTRLNSSHQIISYAVFCLKKKKARSLRGRYSSATPFPDRTIVLTLSRQSRNRSMGRSRQRASTAPAAESATPCGAD